MERLSVSDVMTCDLVAVGPDSSVAAVGELFRERHIGGAPVIEPTGRLLGVVTLKDLVSPDDLPDRNRRHAQDTYFRVSYGAVERCGSGSPLSHRLVEEVMSPYVISIGPDAPLATAARLMVKDGVHRLLVLDDGILVGIITPLDILRALYGSLTRTEESSLPPS